jgi:hypothetical protein
MDFLIVYHCSYIINWRNRMGVNVHILKPPQSRGAQGWKYKRLKKKHKWRIFCFYADLLIQQHVFPESWKCWFISSMQYLSREILSTCWDYNDNSLRVSCFLCPDLHDKGTQNQKGRQGREQTCQQPPLFTDINMIFFVLACSAAPWPKWLTMIQVRLTFSMESYGSFLLW